MRQLSSPSLRDPQAGSSLVEVLVAALVLGIGLLGLAMGQAQSLDELRRGGSQLQARLLAVALVEQRRAAGPTGVPAAELAAWRERVGRRLPAGQARVQWPSTPAGTGQVALTWTQAERDREAGIELWFVP